MKRIFFLVVLVVVGLSVFAQNDSAAWMGGAWKTRTISKGVVWRSIRFDRSLLFGARENCDIIEISPGGWQHWQLSLAHSDSLEKTSRIALDRGALAAINGSFFRMRGPDPDHRRDLNGVPKLEPSRLAINRSVVYLRENGSLVSGNIPDKDSIRKRHQQGDILLNDGRLSIVKAGAGLGWEQGVAAQGILSTGPVMLLSGFDQPIPADDFCRNRYPRTAIGKKGDGTVVLFTVDGRAAESAGMSIPELQQVMRWLGCIDAINLDGGGSTTMYVKGEPFSGVVNYPTDNKRFDHEGEREVANALVLVSRPAVSLTLIPPSTVTDKVNLDVRAGIRNLEGRPQQLEVSFYWDEEKGADLLYRTRVSIAAGGARSVKFLLPTNGRVGRHTILARVKGSLVDERISKEITVVGSDVWSTRTIGGAWISFYHWSETEGKNWNPALRTLTDEQWKEMVGSMHRLGMDIIVMQESFRNQEYVGKHTIPEKGYGGKAYYPSALFPGRMPIAARDPVEAVLSEADRLNMHVFVGVGMYAWFDYTPGSLLWHEKVAKELWDRYGGHPSFYGFYVSEEGMGSLDCFETDAAKQDLRRKQVLAFFREFTPFCNRMAPGRPVMFAPNGWGVGRSKGAYPELLKQVDIICPFAFARMPPGDLSGKEAIRRLQQYCNDAGAHLWLDLEAFLIQEKEGFLYPRPLSEIKGDLDHFTNFEKIICYQYPGVFSDPAMPVRVGEASTEQLFLDYQKYLEGRKK